MLVSKLGKAGALEVGLSGSCTVMHGDDQRCRMCERSGLILVHLHIGGVGPEVYGDLLERARKRIAEPSRQ